MPSSAATRSSSPRRPEPRPDVGAADAVVGDLDGDVAGAARERDRRLRGARVLGDVGERLGGDEVGRALDRLGQAVPARDVERDGDRRAAGQRLQRRLQPALGEHGGMDAAREVAQLLQARLQLRDRAVEQLGDVVVALGLQPRAAQQQRERDEPRLRAVVQVALQPPARRVARLHDPRARGAQLVDARLQLVVEVRDVAAQQAREVGERHQRGRDERGPERGVARAGLRDRHEREGEQREDVDGRHLQALERRRWRASGRSRGAARARTGPRRRARRAPSARPRRPARRRSAARCAAPSGSGEASNSSAGTNASGKIT